MNPLLTNDHDVHRRKHTRRNRAAGIFGTSTTDDATRRDGSLVFYGCTFVREALIKNISTIPQKFSVNISLDTVNARFCFVFTIRGITGWKKRRKL